MNEKFNDMMKQARAMQDQLQKAQDRLGSVEATGQSGAGMVRVTMTGKHEVRRVLIEPEVLSENKVVIEGLIAAAVNDARCKVDKEARSQLAGLAGGMGGVLPGFWGAS